MHASVDTDGSRVRMRTLDLPGAPGPVRLPDRNSDGTGAQQPQAQGSRVGMNARPAPGSPSQQRVQKQQQDLLDERRSSNGAASTRGPAAGRATPAHRGIGNGAGPKPRQTPAPTTGTGAATRQAISTDIRPGGNRVFNVPTSSSMSQLATVQGVSPRQANDAVLPSAAASAAALSGNRAPGMLASDFDGEPCCSDHCSVQQLQQSQQLTMLGAQRAATELCVTWPPVLQPLLRSALMTTTGGAVSPTTRRGGLLTSGALFWPSGAPQSTST